MLLARWGGVKNVDIREAISKLAKQEGDAREAQIEMCEWLAEKKVKEVVDEAWDKLAELEARNESESPIMPQDNEY